MPDSLFKPQPLELDSPEKVEALFKELASNIEATEIKVKEVEDAFNTSAVSSINQLRYAGYHLCQVIAKSQLYTTPAIIEYSHILSAYKHSLRAYYDALDHASVVVTSAFKQMEKTYNDLLVPLSEHFSDYHQWRREIDGLAKLRSLGEENALYETAVTKEKRDAYYVRLDAKIKAVLIIYEHLPLMADQLAIIVAKKETERKKEGKTQRNWLITVLVAVIGIGVTYYSRRAPDAPPTAIAAPVTAIAAPHS
jgi:hypothetical protein